MFIFKRHIDRSDIRIRYCVPAISFHSVLVGWLQVIKKQLPLAAAFCI